MEKGPAGRTRAPSRRKRWGGWVVLFLLAGIPGCGGPSLLVLLGAGEGDVSLAGGPEPEPPWRSGSLAPRCLGLSPCPGLHGSARGSQQLLQENGEFVAKQISSSFRSHLLAHEAKPVELQGFEVG